MAVLRPLKVVITNYPEGQVEQVDVINNPEDSAAGTRKVPFSRELYIEREDFMEEPPKKFFRLAPGREVRLRYAYFITCTGVVKDDRGEIVELHCTYDPATRRRRLSRQAPGESDAPLGFEGARGAGRGSPVRPPLFCRGSRRRHRFGSDIHRSIESELARNSAWLPRGTKSVGRSGGQPLSVRATGVLLRRYRVAAGGLSVQSDGFASRHLGQDRAETG